MPAHARLLCILMCIWISVLAKFDGVCHRVLAVILIYILENLDKIERPNQRFDNVM